MKDDQELEDFHYEDDEEEEEEEDMMPEEEPASFRGLREI